MLRSVTRAAVLAATIAGVAFPNATPALAHTGREVGQYHFLVGWGTEPTFSGFANSVQLILSDHNDKPVTNLGDTLTVAVSFGTAEAKTFALEPNFEVGEWGTPGDYRAFFVPTRSGPYTFHFTGTIKGQKVNQTFTSSETTFDDAKDPSGVEYPRSDPSNAQLSDKLDRIDPRLSAARSAAESGKTLGYVGIGVGAAGLLLAAFALTRGRQTA